LTDQTRNKYLILDVLGQGTFGQVVKCQNLRTGEVIAVKVVKNKTAYFNQSMMEVSVLDLVDTEQCLFSRVSLNFSSLTVNWTRMTTITYYGSKTRSYIVSIYA